MQTNALELISHDYMHSLAGNPQLLKLLQDALRSDVVAITGGTGFIGTWLTGLITYLNDHHGGNTQVVLIAKNIEQFRAAKPHLANRKDVRLMAADVRYLIELPSDTNWLIHAAGTPDNRFHATYPVETMSTIANGTYSVLRTVERCSNLKMLLNLSSGLVYGIQPFTQDQLDENYPGAPHCGSASSAYAEAKRYAETLCQASRSQARIPVVTARPFAFIGPYQSLEAPWALNNFIKDALLGHEIRVLGDGKTIRSYMYASDLAVWLLTILTQGQTGEVYNVGSPEPVSLAELAKMVAAQFDTDLIIKLRTSMPTEIQNSRFVPDVNLALQKFGLTLTVNLSEAIRRTIAWNQLNNSFKNNPRETVW
jgi:nucleoside-diphosphate-sugar epimerase